MPARRYRTVLALAVAAPILALGTASPAAAVPALCGGIVAPGLTCAPGGNVFIWTGAPPSVTPPPTSVPGSGVIGTLADFDLSLDFLNKILFTLPAGFFTNLDALF